ncbi:polyphosphate kinase 2 family protein [Flavobacterium denitrificans]|uniref:polyphosphate kinase 2 family protein n=1 Tax=Flavobacterium denitrificans TaxID=281361 RepID=UPI000401C079|nr:polyphosphate kinase 2 family protein [Flavobacterium denitrificans]
MSKKNKKNQDNVDAVPENLKTLSKKELLHRAKKFSEQFCVGDDKDFTLKDKPTNYFGDEKKSAIKDTLKMGVKALAAMQETLYAQDKWSVLVIFQAMDAAGKDGAIKHVMSGINPQGCQVSSFKAPSSEDLDHDYLWRCQKHLPERGRIGIFNRSYYEEVLVVRVHEQILKGQKIPEKLIKENIWENRFEDIRNFERYLNRNGTIVIKFFLNVSKEEQKNRFIERVDNPDKNWKFSASDAKERGYWDDYMFAYEELIKNTSTKKSPWYVIPADNKYYARIAIASAIIHALDEMDLEYPKVSEDKIAELNEVKKALLAEKD